MPNSHDKRIPKQLRMQDHAAGATNNGKWVGFMNKVTLQNNVFLLYL